jgi:dienelactone hydrolase
MRRFSRRKKWLVVIALLHVVGAIVWFVFLRAEPPDARFNGAYRLEDGRLVFVTAREGSTLRYRMMGGESRALWPVGDRSHEAGPGWDGREPVELGLHFDEGDPPPGLTWKPVGDSEQRAERVMLPESVFVFESGEITLRGKLVRPEGEPPFACAVLVHGSGKESAVDTYFAPYLFATHGVAVLVFDKRGTGGSSGDYLQNFHVLADDVVAAVEWLRGQPEIDPDRIHLVGYSQGGWIAPLAASKTDGIRSLLINYGPMVPVTGEDRWGYVYSLQQAGFGEEAIAEADRLNEVASAIFDEDENRWSELSAMLDASEGKDWYEAVKGSDSLIGVLSGTRLPLWSMRVYLWWLKRGDVPFIDRSYDPVPTMTSLDVPSLWIFGGEDSSMPTGWTIEKLEELQAEGRPIEIEVYPDADHGIVIVEEDESGVRKTLGYAPGYLALQVAWLRRHSGLERLAG